MPVWRATLGPRCLSFPERSGIVPSWLGRALLHSALHASVSELSCHHLFLVGQLSRPCVAEVEGASCGQRMNGLFSLCSQVLAGMNVYPSEFESIKEEYSVRGYPTICYLSKSPASLWAAASPTVSAPWLSPWFLPFHRKGRFLFQYDSYGSTAEDIVEWLKK